jgi:hypothetical protein
MATPLPTDSTRRLTIYTTAPSIGSVTTVLSFLNYNTSPSQTTPEATKTGLLKGSPTTVSTGGIQDELKTTIITPNSDGKSVTEIFVQTTYTEYATLIGVKIGSISTAGTVVTVVLGASCIGWNIPVNSGTVVSPPLVIPHAISNEASETPASSTLHDSGLLVTVVTSENKVGSSLLHTFTETKYSAFETTTVQTKITTTVNGTPIPILIGISGLGWDIPMISSTPLPPPLKIPTNTLGFP